MTKKEAMELILNDVINHYNINNLCISSSSSECMYYYKGNTCGIGRWMNNPQDAPGGMYDPEDHFSYLKDEAKLVSTKFLKYIQDLHDSCKTYWDEKGLSIKGKHQVDKISEIFDINYKYEK